VRVDWLGESGASSVDWWTPRVRRRLRDMWRGRYKSVTNGNALSTVTNLSPLPSPFFLQPSLPRDRITHPYRPHPPRVRRPLHMTGVRHEVDAAVAAHAPSALMPVGAERHAPGALHYALEQRGRGRIRRLQRMRQAWIA